MEIDRVFDLLNVQTFFQIKIFARKWMIAIYLHTPPCRQEWEEQSSVFVSQSRPCQPGGQEQDTCRREEVEGGQAASREVIEEDAVGRMWKGIKQPGEKTWKYVEKDAAWRNWKKMQ